MLRCLTVHLKANYAYDLQVLTSNNTNAEISFGPLRPLFFAKKNRHKGERERDRENIRIVIIILNTSMASI